MTVGDCQENLVTYDLATLAFSELLRAHLRGRFPRSRHPIVRWGLSVLVLILGLAFLGFIVGMAEWPRFPVDRMAIAFGMAGALFPLRTLIRLEREVKRVRMESHCTTELSPEGIHRRTLTRECKYRWTPGQKFVAVGDDVMLFLRTDEFLWLPRRAFVSWEMADSFLSAARRYHANAMTHR